MPNGNRYFIITLRNFILFIFTYSFSQNIIGIEFVKQVFINAKSCIFKTKSVFLKARKYSINSIDKDADTHHNHLANHSVD